MDSRFKIDKLHNYLSRFKTEQLNKKENNEFGELLLHNVKYYVLKSQSHGLKIPNSSKKIFLFQEYRQEIDEIIQRGIERLLTRENPSRENPGLTMAFLEYNVAVAIMDYTYTQKFRRETNSETINSDIKRKNENSIYSQVQVVDISDTQYFDKTYSGLNNQDFEEYAISQIQDLKAENITQQEKDLLFQRLLTNQSLAEIGRNNGNTSGENIRQKTANTAKKLEKILNPNNH